MGRGGRQRRQQGGPSLSVKRCGLASTACLPGFLPARPPHILPADWCGWVSELSFTCLPVGFECQLGCLLWVGWVGRGHAT